MDMKFMQTFNIDNIRVYCKNSCVINFTKEGGINYDEIISENG